jgi:tripartite-type tricarboxylate transporter receptor subunit TctC
MGRHIPGKPTIIPQNMPGAGSAIVVQNLLKAAPRDGSVLGAVGQYIAFDQIAKDLTDKYDTRELNWLGNPDESNAIMPVWAATGVKTIEDARKREVILGGTAPNAASDLGARALNNIIGTKFKLIDGFNGNDDIDLAMERREVDGRASTFWVDLKARHPDWIRDRKVNILLQFGYEREPELSNVPLMLDLARTPAERQVFEMMSANARIGHPFVTTPGVPADRLAALKAAFAAAMKDPQLLAEAAKQILPIHPVSGERLAATVAKVVDAPPEVVKLFKAAIAKGETFNCNEIAKDKSLCARPRK